MQEGGQKKKASVDSLMVPLVVVIVQAKLACLTREKEAYFNVFDLPAPSSLSPW